MSLCMLGAAAYRKMRFVIVTGILGCALLATSHGAPGGVPAASAPPSSTQLSLQDIAAKRKELAAQLEALRTKSGDPSVPAEDGNVSAADDEREFLESLDGVYAEQQVRLEQQQELEAEKATATEALESLRKFGPSEPKPYSFLLLEDLRDELAAEEDHGEALTAELKPASQMLEAAQAHFAEAEKNRRRAQENAAENRDRDRAGVLAAELQLAQRESQLAKEMIAARRLEVDVRNLRCDVSASRKTQLAETIAQVGKEVHFNRVDLQDRLKELAESDGELAAQIKQSQAQAKRAEAQQVVDLQALRAEHAPQAIIALATASWRVARDAQQIQDSLLRERLADNQRLRHYWECRYELENGSAKDAEIAQWHESLQTMVEELSDKRRALEQRIDATRTEQARIVERMQDEEDAAAKKWRDFQCAQWQTLREACETQLVQLKVVERWSGRFLEELAAKLQPQDKTNWRTVAAQNLSSAWNYEFFPVNDQPITVGKVVKLVIFLLAGVIAARVLSRLFGRRLLPHFGLNEGASHAVQSIAFYALSASFGVLSFQVVHIPLAAFAFLGGAVAIAIGFGSQDIANNFMSGIILLAEQPIRVGDIILVDGVQGTVDHIGPRSTRIKTDANHELIVPNSKLLSDKVTNLTLSDSLIQAAIAVTLPGRMPIGQAKRLLLEAARSHPAVLNEPAPYVLFKQLGAASMDFELHFWLNLDDETRSAVTQSELRETISELFLQGDGPATIAAAAATPAAPTAGPAASSRRASAA